MRHDSWLHFTLDSTEEIQKNFLEKKKKKKATPHPRSTAVEDKVCTWSTKKPSVGWAMNENPTASVRLCLLTTEDITTKIPPHKLKQKIA